MLTNSMELLWFIVGLIAVAAVVVFFMRRAMRGRKLSGQSARRVQQAWAHVESLQDPIRKVMEADKVLDLALGALGYTGSVADKLKKAGPRINNLQAVWDAHKLRNHLAHETQATVTPAQAEQAVRMLKVAVDSLGK